MGIETEGLVVTVPAISIHLEYSVD